MGYSLNQFYRAIGTSKQAVHQEHIRQQQFYQQLEELIILMDVLRTEHPGCGLAKAYDTLRPSFIGRDRFIDIFMELGYRVRWIKNAIKTTKPGSYRCENLIEGMVVFMINQVLQSDITFILVNGIFYYAVFIIDVYSKRIVGYQVSDNMRVEANIKALKQVIKLRGKAAMEHTIHHSDRGSQYGAKLYRQLLKKMKCWLSMGLSAQQNAYAERVNGIIKNEYLAYWNIPDFTVLKKKLKQAVDHYNHKRIHRHLPMNLSPVQFEEQWINSLKLQQHKELIHSTNNFVIRSKQKKFFKQLESINGLFCPLKIL